MDQVQYHRISDVAKMTGMSSRFVRAEIARGHLPIARLNRSITIADQDVRAYLNARRVKAVTS